MPGTVKAHTNSIVTNWCDRVPGKGRDGPFQGEVGGSVAQPVKESAIFAPMTLQDYDTMHPVIQVCEDGVIGGKYIAEIGFGGEDGSQGVKIVAKGLCAVARRQQDSYVYYYCG